MPLFQSLQRLKITSVFSLLLFIWISGCSSGENLSPLQSHLLKSAPEFSQLIAYTQKKGTGPQTVKGQTLSIHYNAWLVDNTEKQPRKGLKFDSSHLRDQPLKIKLGEPHSIAGLQKGITGMQVGEKRTLIIPSRLAYGERGAGSTVPANTPLIFEVELLKIH